MLPQLTLLALLWPSLCLDGLWPRWVTAWKFCRPCTAAPAIGVPLCLQSNAGNAALAPCQLPTLCSVCRLRFCYHWPHRLQLDLHLCVLVCTSRLRQCSCTRWRNTLMCVLMTLDPCSPSHYSCPFDCASPAALMRRHWCVGATLWYLTNPNHTVIRQVWYQLLQHPITVPNHWGAEGRKHVGFPRSFVGAEICCAFY